MSPETQACCFGGLQTKLELLLSEVDACTAALNEPRAPTVQIASFAKDKAVLVALSKGNPDVRKLPQDFLYQATRSDCCRNGKMLLESWVCHGGSQKNLPQHTCSSTIGRARHWVF